MSPEETLRICRLAKAASPAQAVDEYTPEVWALVLRPYRYVDAEQALTELAGEQEWIHVSHIRKRIKKIRGDRLAAFGVMPDPPPSLDPADTTGYRDWFVSTREAIADGELTTPEPQLESSWTPEKAEARIKYLRAELARRAPAEEGA